MESLFSFPVGLSHPLQHAGLARRTPVCPWNGALRCLRDDTRVHGRYWQPAPQERILYAYVEAGLGMS